MTDLITRVRRFCKGDGMTQFPLEAGLTASLWDLFASDGASALSIEALARQLPANDPRVRRLVASAENHGSRAWLPSRAPSPDLALIAPDNSDGVADVLAVIEVKARAQTNWPLNSSAEKLPVLKGDIAASITAAYATEEDICQVDLYRSRQWWNEIDGIALEDPDQALWLLLDTRGRAVEEAFKMASMPSVWISINLKLFAAHLRELRQSWSLTDHQRDTITVVLWHIDQAPGKEPEVGAEIAAPPVHRPSADDIDETHNQDQAELIRQNG